MAALLVLGVAGTVWAAPDPRAAINDYGNVGLLQTPTARFNGAGQLRLGYASAKPYNTTFISAQPYDWLEATFRYVNFSYDGVDGGPFVRDGYLDKSFDFKVGLLAESRRWPAIALGIQDLGGTGLLASEFLVASKRWGAVDLSLGVGWGRLGARGNFRNVLISADPSLAEREGIGDSGEPEFGGEFELKQLFSGERIDVFGGLHWAPASSRWSFALERDGNDYSLEPFGNRLDVDWPVNLGAAYAADWFAVRLGWLRGNQLMFSIYLANDLSNSAPKALDPPPTPVAESTNVPAPTGAERVNNLNLPINNQAIDEALKRQNILLLRAETAVLGWQLNVWVTQGPYRDADILTDRVARTLSMLAQKDVAMFQIITVAGGLERSRVKIDRNSVTRIAAYGAPLGKGAAQAAPAPVDIGPVPEDPVLSDGPLDFNWFMGPRYRQSLGDPDESYRASLFWQVGVDWQWSAYLSTSIRAEAELIGNLDEIERESDSVLPRVRSDIAEYNRQGANGLRRMELNYVRPINTALTWRVSVGIFEEMYGGAAGEILYRPTGQDWAVGTTLNAVRQRDFDQRLGFRDYQVTTGHLTLYKQFQTLGLHTQASVGCYLARDCGGTIVAARVFNSGASFGVFATKTDVSSEEFGEGSFDKGFFVSIPFDSFLPMSTRSRASFSFRPLTRDGGQKVRGGSPLYR